MLGKLLKYEIKATARTFIPLYGLLLLFAAANRIFIMVNNGSPLFKIFAALISVGYVLTIILVFALTVIIMIQRFFKNLLGDEGYLMFTLPVSSWKHIVSKLLISMMWVILGVAFTLLSLLIVAANNELYSNITTGIQAVVSALSRYDLNAYALFIQVVFASVISLITGILMIYTSIAVGHLFNSHKLLASFGAFVVFYMISQAVVMIIMTVISVANPGLMMNTAELEKAINYLPHLVLLGSTCLSAAFGVAYFFITNYILRKRLNLE